MASGTHPSTTRPSLRAHRRASDPRTHRPLPRRGPLPAGEPPALRMTLQHTGVRIGHLSANRRPVRHRPARHPRCHRSHRPTVPPHNSFPRSHRRRMRPRPMLRCSRVSPQVTRATAPTKPAPIRRVRGPLRPIGPGSSGFPQRTLRIPRPGLCDPLLHLRGQEPPVSGSDPRCRRSSSSQGWWRSC